MPDRLLDNGISSGMTRADVKNILGQRLSGDKYQTYYLTKTSRVELDFAHYSDEGEGDKAYKVNGILVRKLNPTKE